MFLNVLVLFVPLLTLLYLVVDMESGDFDVQKVEWNEVLNDEIWDGYIEEEDLNEADFDGSNIQKMESVPPSKAMMA